MAVTHSLATFTSDKAGPKWREWYGLSPAEQARRDEAGLNGIAAWEAAHRDSLVYGGGALGPPKRIDAAGAVTDVVNLLTVFLVVRADSPEAACRLLEHHPHITHFVCDGVEVMPVLGGEAAALAEDG